MKKRRSAVAVALCVSLLACACAASDHTDKEKDKAGAETQKPEEKEYQGKLDAIQPSAYNNVEGLDLEPGSYISVIGKSESGEYWEEVKKGAAQAASDINAMLGYEGKNKVKVTYSGASDTDNVDEQVNILDEELARYPVALAISITDASACEVQFDLAAESGIPVVAFDSGSDYQGLMATIATDNDASAREAAVKLAELIDDEGEVILFIQDSKSKAAQTREAAFRDEIEKNHPGISVVEAYHMDQLSELQKIVADEIKAGTYSREVDEGRDPEQEILPESITEEDVVDYIFAKHPNVKGCFGANAGAVQLAVDGLARMQLEDVSVVGYDINEKVLEELANGTVDGLIVQNPFGMGYAAVVASARASLEMGNEAVVNTGYLWISKENMDEKGVEKMLY